jgi:hypothetical protein
MRCDGAKRGEPQFSIALRAPVQVKFCLFALRNFAHLFVRSKILSHNYMFSLDELRLTQRTSARQDKKHKIKESQLQPMPANRSHARASSLNIYIY